MRCSLLNKNARLPEARTFQSNKHHQQVALKFEMQIKSMNSNSIAFLFYKAQFRLLKLKKKTRATKTRRRGKIFKAIF
jgi:hypothetical protein